MKPLQVVEFLVKSGWNREAAREYVDVLVSVFWGQLKTAY